MTFEKLFCVWGITAFTTFTLKVISVTLWFFSHFWQEGVKIAYTNPYWMTYYYTDTYGESWLFPTGYTDPYGQSSYKMAYVCLVHSMMDIKKEMLYQIHWYSTSWWHLSFELCMFVFFSKEKDKAQQKKFLVSRQPHASLKRSRIKNFLPFIKG